MTNIILQHFDGTLRDLDKLSIENIRQYAEQIGAEYQLITGKPFRRSLIAPCQKVIILDEYFDKWDNVVMLDIDMFRPRNMDLNIFEERGIGLHASTQQILHTKIATRFPSIASINIPYWGGAIYKLNYEQRAILRRGLGGDESWMLNYNEHISFADEGIMHTLAVKTNFNPPYPYLEQKWCQCSFLPNPEQAAFLHIRTKITPNGPKREKIENYQSLVDLGVI